MSAWRGPGGALALALSLAAPARADPDGTPPVTRVEVVGTLPFADPGIVRDRLPYTVQALDRAQLRQAQPDNLAELMARKLNGVNVNDIAGSPFQADVTYRGYRASPVLGTAQGLSVYLDGVRVNEPFGDVVNWDMLPEAAIGSLQLVPGSNPLYGLNTLGGALVLQTRSGLDAQGIETQLSTGSAGRRRADLSYGARGADGWHSFVAATLFEERGWRAHSNGRLGNLFVKVGRAAGPNEWSATLLGARSDLFGNGLLPDGLYATDRRAAYTFPDRSGNLLLQGAVRLAQRLGRGWKLSASAYARGSRRDSEGGDIAQAYGDYVQDCGAGFDATGAPNDAASCQLSRQQGAALPPAVLNATLTRQHGHGASLNLHAAQGGHTFDAGAAYDRSRVHFAQFEQDATFTPQREVQAIPGSARASASAVEGGTRALALYAAGTWALAASSHVNASVRMNHARVGGTLTTEHGQQAPEAFTYSRLNPALGFTHETGALTWFGNLAQGNRVPTAIELGCADPAQPCRLPVGLQSDPYLRQVVARTIEAGARARWGALEAELSLYRTVNRDDILFVNAAASHAGYFANFPRTLHQGLGLGVGRRGQDVEWRADYSYLDATYDAAGSLFAGARTVAVRPGTRIAGLPRHTLKLGLDWNAGPALSVGVDLQAMSPLVAQGNEDGLVAGTQEGAPRPADMRVRGYALLNLRALWRVGRGWELFARATNVLDRRYETYAFAAPDLFPNGQLLQPRVAPGAAATARFVAPGAPRLLTAGLRYRF